MSAEGPPQLDYSSPIQLSKEMMVELTGAESAAQLLKMMDNKVTYPTVEEVARSVEDKGVIRLHERDINIARFIPPYSAISRIFGYDFGYEAWSRSGALKELDEDGFYLGDRSKFGLPLVSGLELYTYVLWNAKNK